MPRPSDTGAAQPGREPVCRNIQEAFRPFLGGDDLSHDEIAARLSLGPVPLPFIVDCARRSGFTGLPWLEQALSVTASAAQSPKAAARRSEKGGADSVESAFELIFSELGEERPGQLAMALTVARLSRACLALYRCGE